MLAYIRKNDLLRPGDRVGIAVSGGADSVALLRLMLELRDELGILPSVVHLNHKLRGADSDEDEQFVRRLAGTYGLEIFAESRDVKAFSTDKKMSVEAAAREARYEFFKALLKNRQLDKIVTAHTKDDQAETVVLRLLRGTGFRGLGGIRPRLFIRDEAAAACGEIVRPLLSTRRDAVTNYLVQAKQTWHEDETNNEVKYTRNRVRQVLMPLLQKEFNPAVSEKLAEFAEIAQGEEEFWTKECDRLLGEIGRVNKMGWQNATFYSPITDPANPLPRMEIPGPGTGEKLAPGRYMMDIGLSLSDFRELPLATRRRLLQSLGRFRIELEFKNIDEIIWLVENHSGSPQEIRLPSGWRVICTREELRFFTNDEHANLTDYYYPLSVPGKVSIPEADLELETVVLNENSEAEYHGTQNLLDSRFAQKPWVIRNWRPGERFWPAHTKEPKKIKELLQDRHITGQEKQRWPVIACEDEIIWLSGFGVRRDFQATGGAGVLIREIQGRQK